MFRHNQNTEIKPERVLILGGGFISSAIQEKLLINDINFVCFRSSHLDLTSNQAVETLNKTIKKTDTIVFIAAQAPVKNENMLVNNILMAKSVCEAIKENPPQHLIYISSDAVYSDSDRPLSEDSICSPDNLHGIMHLSREVMLKNAYGGPLCIFRPTLIFGDGDPHNGYGPNRFLRLSKNNEDIVLFGEGEELRDHVWIDNVADAILKSILYKSEGMLNLVSGVMTSFKEIAYTVVNNNSTKSRILTSKRIGTMPHNGYREFDVTNLKKAMPDLNFVNVIDWLKLNRTI